MPKKPKPEFMPPAKIGACVDMLYTTRQHRLADLTPPVKDAEDIEKALKEHLIATLPKSEATGAAGKLARASIVVKSVPTVEDWDALYEFIRKKRRFDLLNRALNAAAVTEMWENGETVPGVVPFQAVTVSVNKI